VQKKIRSGLLGVIGIKVGSSSLVTEKGRVRESVIRSQAKQAKGLMERGYGIFIVASGAVACSGGKSRSRNLRAAIGQVRIMNHYAKAFRKCGIEVAQALLTDREIRSENSSQIRLTLHEAFMEGVVVIINANDVIDNEELNALEFCADNDRLFGAVCKITAADHGIIVFNEAGFHDDSGKIIHEIHCSEAGDFLAFADGGNKLGHGDRGMATKLEVLCDLARNGIGATLVSAAEKDFMTRALAQEEGFGTRFLE